jgi:DNA-binding HxlR family transcriptional regulator
MKAETRKRTSGCPVAFGLDTFGDRWSLLIIREIMLRGKRTYSEFLQAEEGIATNILIDRLKHLEAEGIVEKSRDPDNRRSFIYTLTQKGRDLAPIILEIVIWSGAYDDRPNAMRDVLQKVQSDRAGFEAQLRAGESV